MDDSTKLKIDYEISQIDELMEKSNVLVSLCKSKTPDFIEMSAVGSILHSFYNGLENIFVLIAKSEKCNFSASNHWHRDLLDFVFSAQTPTDESMKSLLIEYMGFRHFFRHTYGYTIQWEKCKHLFLGMDDFWHQIREWIIYNKY